MAKYKRSIQGGGFRPEQISGQGEARLQEYADRIANALREERDAVISNRNRIASAMKENAQIESAQLDRDSRIEQQNIQNKIDEARQMSQRAMQEFETNNAATKQMFGTLSKLSNTAALKLQELELERVHKQWDKDFYETLMLGNNAPGVKHFEAVGKESTAKQIELSAALYEAKRNGADEVEVSEAGKLNRELSYGARAATYYLLATKYGTHLRNWLMDDTVQYTDSAGNTFTGKEASRNREWASIVTGAAFNNFLNINQIKGTNPALLHKSGLINTMLAENQQVMRIAGKAQIDDNNTEADLQFTSGWANQVDTLSAKRFIEENWIDLVNRKGLAGALDYLTNLAMATDVDGKPVYDTQALMAAELGADGQVVPFGNRKERRAKIEKALREANSASFRAEEIQKQQTAITAYRDKREEIQAQLSAAGARDDADIFATAKQAFWEQYGYYPPEMLEDERRNLAANKAEDEAQLEVITRYAADGLLTQGQVLSIADPVMRKQAQGLLDQQNKITKFGPNYEETLKSLKQDAKKILGDSLQGGSTSQAVDLEIYMQKQFAAWYKEGLQQNNNDPTAALIHANQKHQAEMGKSLAGLDDGLYVTKPGAHNNATLPNIEKERKQRASESAQNVKNIENAVSSLGMEALNRPNVVTSKNKLREISQTHYTGGGISTMFTPEILAAARLLNISPIEVINKQIETHNKYFPTDIIQPLQGPTLDMVNNARPETQRLLSDLPTVGSVDRAQAQMQREPLRDPNNMRRTFAYLSGNIGPTSTAAHLDVKKVGGGEFSPDALDEYVEVDDPEFGTVPLSKVPVTGDFASHTARGSHGIDYGLYSNTKVFLKNGARVINSRPSVHGDVLLIELPNGDQYTFLHGKTPRN